VIYSPVCDICVSCILRSFSAQVNDKYIVMFSVPTFHYNCVYLWEIIATIIAKVIYLINNIINILRLDRTGCLVALCEKTREQHLRERTALFTRGRRHDGSWCCKIPIRKFAKFVVNNFFLYGQTLFALLTLDLGQ
jgi:hypothetical protein